jgi:hypothetical protein
VTVHPLPSIEPSTRDKAVSLLKQAHALEIQAVGIIFDALESIGDTADLGSASVKRTMELLDVTSRSTVNAMCRDGRLVKNDLGHIAMWSLRDYQRGLRPKRNPAKGRARRLGTKKNNAGR